MVKVSKQELFECETVVCCFVRFASQGERIFPRTGASQAGSAQVKHNVRKCLTSTQCSVGSRRRHYLPHLVNSSGAAFLSRMKALG
ncbi:hypothetical protein E2C01_025218 [Portunus trituberculatus]|uniref:Uncharacterized protein n=1 Tax=Portunus trituberculatus TaxID=210409 RepID=A0A5B7EEL8_PORTR|nr:hypothetical protein [Portunus trituberculatus]